MSKNKHIVRRKRQEELLQHFQQEEDHYEEKHIGDNWYIKSYNGNTERWQVGVFTEQSYRRYKSYTREKEDEESRLDHLLADDDFERPTLESIKKLVNEHGQE